MSVFDNRDGFRPRDQSVSTKLKYETEAQHWADAFNSTRPTNRPPNFAKDFASLGLVVGLFINLIIIVVLSLTNLFKWITKATSKSEVKTNSASIQQEDNSIQNQ